MWCRITLRTKISSQSEFLIFPLAARPDDEHHRYGPRRFLRPYCLVPAAVRGVCSLWPWLWRRAGQILVLYYLYTSLSIRIADHFINGQEGANAIATTFKTFDAEDDYVKETLGQDFF